LPFLLFIPGYVLTFALFPTKKIDEGIDFIERIILSISLSIAIVSLIGLLLNYSPWGIRLEPIFLSIFTFTIVIGIIAIYRWFIALPNQRFILSFEWSLSKSEKKVDKAFTIILIALIIITIASLLYLIIYPKIGEQYTEFYVLNQSGTATGYPEHIILGENATVLIGVSNHENKKINYTIEIWLINQTAFYNESTNQNETIYNHMWFMNKTTVRLPHLPITRENTWVPQWQYNYTFSVNKQGNFKLAFLLFKTLTENYSYSLDYKDIAKEKINNAYRELYLWIQIT
jgi:uncharacterized membrane protein